jgi:hypothetical protein
VIEFDGPANAISSATEVVGATGSKKRHPGRSLARQSAVCSKNGCEEVQYFSYVCTILHQERVIELEKELRLRAYT